MCRGTWGRRCRRADATKRVNWRVATARGSLPPYNGRLRTAGVFREGVLMPDWMGLPAALVTAFATLVTITAGGHQLWSAYRRRVPARIGWGAVEQGVRQIIARLRSDNYAPDVVVAIGRSGAILGGLIAGNMQNLPLALLDRKFTWDHNRREYLQGEFSDVHIVPACRRVLVVVGEVYSGQTLIECLRSLEPALGDREVRTCTLVKSRTSTFNVDYFVFEVDGMVTPAWVLSPDYHRVATSTVNS